MPYVSIGDYQKVSLMMDVIKDRSSNGMVETEIDWDIVTMLYTYWKKQQPEEYAYFQKSVKFYREYYRLNNQHGVAEEKSGASLQHLIEIPEYFYKIFTSVFPNQRWDRPFIRKFIDRIPDFKMHDKKI